MSQLIFMVSDQNYLKKQEEFGDEELSLVDNNEENSTDEESENSEGTIENTPLPNEGQIEISPNKEIEHYQEIKKEDESAIGRGITNIKNKLGMNKKSTNIPQVRDELTVKIEKIMEEGLKDAYQELTTIQKQEFKIKGEDIAWQIRNLLKGTSIKVKQIFKLLMEWLKMLPGVNHFFLEQEAKIKADKIITLKKHF